MSHVAQGIGEPKMLNMASDSAMVDWLKNTDEAGLGRFHTLQLMLNKALARIKKEDALQEKLNVYDVQIQGMPSLMDRVLKSHGGEVFLSHFVHDIASNPQSAEGILATDLLVGSFSPPLLMWLNEIATPKEKAIFANFATEVCKIRQA